MSGVAVVIEDDEAISALVGAYLEKAGFDVVRECTGAGGLDAVERRQPRFVVLDLGLPDLDGFELCRQLRGSGDVPILILTARDEEADRIIGLEPSFAGAFANDVEARLLEVCAHERADRFVVFDHHCDSAHGRNALTNVTNLPT